MRSLRRWFSERLLSAGTRMAMDREEMVRAAHRSGHRYLSNRDLQLLFMLDVVSSAKIKIGMLLMPAGVPEPLTGEVKREATLD